MADSTQGQLSPGTTLRQGAYRIERILGQGGFGITYLATHIRLNREVAVKEFFPKTLCVRDGDTSFVRNATEVNAELVSKLRRKFLKEAEHIAEMDSPYIVKITDVFEENNTAYYAMEYIEGQDLSKMVKSSGPIPVPQAVEYINKIGQALTYIHSKRINHLDIKPANILIRQSDNNPVIIDFGLSKQYDTEGNQTSTTPVGISHGYAPMEQYKDGGVKEFSPQTDLYALAATLYYILSGVTPPQAHTIFEEPLTFPDTIPPSLIPPITRAMAPRRADRHPTVPDFLRQLPSLTQSSQSSQSTSPHPDTTIPAPHPQDGNAVPFDVNRRLQPAEPSALEPEASQRDAANPASLAPSSEESTTIEPTLEESPKSKFKLYTITTIILAAIILAAIALIIFNENREYKATNSINGHEYVDLGLPSGLKWATCNIGATAPEYYGEHFDWGETQPNRRKDKAKTVSELISTGIINTDSILTPKYDAAIANWGIKWRMPTKADFNELVEECNWVWHIQNGTAGFTIIGPNGNSLFLPCAGKKSSGWELSEGGSYWSSTATADYKPAIMDFNNGYHHISFGGSGIYGLRSVRPVAD